MVKVLTELNSDQHETLDDIAEALETDLSLDYTILSTSDDGNNAHIVCAHNNGQKFRVTVALVEDE